VDLIKAKGDLIKATADLVKLFLLQRIRKGPALLPKKIQSSNKRFLTEKLFLWKKNLHISKRIYFPARKL